MKTLKEITTDILIIGAGPAGLSAAIYAARAGKDTVVLKGKGKSHLELAHRVENYPGIDSCTGPELLATMENQARGFGAKIIKTDALEMGLGMDPKIVTTRSEFIQAKSVILALGKGEHKQSIKNEADYLGMGLSYCAVCDGAFYREKKVAVYGNDREALEDALMLQQLGCRTVWISYCGEKSCPEELIDLAKTKGLEMLDEAELVEVNGNGRVQSITVRRQQDERRMDVDGLFIIQAVPSSSLLKKSGVNLTNKDCVAVDREMRTNIPGVFAAGDITCGGLQVAIANGEGVIAALEALKYIRNR